LECGDSSPLFFARLRHTNTLVIADQGFPFWPEIETVDISLVDEEWKLGSERTLLIGEAR